MNINPEKFALAVIASSNSDMTIKEKIDLYHEAYSEALKANQKSQKPTITTEEKIKRAKSIF